jgi:hypothetical protein
MQVRIVWRERGGLDMLSRTHLGLAAALVVQAVAPHAASRPLFQMPVPCGQTWDASTYDGHWPDEDSIDIAERDDSGTNISEGEPILASYAGTVVKAFTTDGGDHRVVLDHGNGWETLYIHIEEVPPLAIGQKVAQGEQIGRASNSGAVAMHLHYTQRLNDDAQRIQLNGVDIATHAGNLSSYDTWGTDDAEKLTSLNCAGNSFMGWNQGGDRYYQLYKPGSGETKIVRMDDDGAGVTTTWSDTWSRGWTHFMPYYQQGGNHPHAIVYKSSTGKVAFVRLDLWGAGVTNLANQTWWGGWNHFVPFVVDGVTHFIAYDSLHGYANIDRIHALGDNTTNVYKGAWDKGRTSLVPFVLGPTQYLLLYKGGTGEVEIDKIAKSGGDIAVTEVWSGTWSSGWTDLVAVAHEGSVYLLGYKADSGSAKLMKVKANGQGVSTTSSMSWTTPWTAFSPFSIGGDGHLLLYKAGTGEVKTLRLKPGGSGFDTIWVDSWTKGWA